MQADSGDIQSLKKCPFCGKDIKKSAYLCPFCHESLAELDQREWNEAASAAEPEESEGASAPSDIREDSLSSLSIALIVAAVVILAILISYQLFSIRSRGGEDTFPELSSESSRQAKSAAKIQRPAKLEYVEPVTPAATDSAPKPIDTGRPNGVSANAPSSTTGPAPAGAAVDLSGVNLQNLIPGRADMTRAFIKSKLGEPDLEYARTLDYNLKYGFELVMAQQGDVLEQIQINSDRFDGKLASGISLSSPMQDVFDAYGEPLGQKYVDELLLDSARFKDAILYESGRFGRISYKKAGLTFWFHRERVIQIGIGKAG